MGEEDRGRKHLLDYSASEIVVWMKWWFLVGGMRRGTEFWPPLHRTSSYKRYFTSGWHEYHHKPTQVLLLPCLSFFSASSFLLAVFVLWRDWNQYRIPSLCDSSAFAWSYVTRVLSFAALVILFPSRIHFGDSPRDIAKCIKLLRSVDWVDPAYWKLSFGHGRPWQPNPRPSFEASY